MWGVGGRNPPTPHISALTTAYTKESLFIWSRMRVRPIDLGLRRDVWQFVNFPFSLYRDCPLWVPPLVSEARNNLNRQKHPFYQHSSAQFYLAESQGQLVGRIAVMDNRRANNYRQTQTAFFGFFESVDDQAAALALFEAAFDWARQRGLKRIIGTRGLIGTDGGGVLVEGFEHRPALGIPYNFSYYDDLIQAAGFEKDTDHLSGYARGDHILPERIERIAERLRRRNNLWVKSFTSKGEMRQFIPRVTQVHRQAFAGTHTFYPPSEAEMSVIAETLISIADPRLIKLAMKGDDVIGFIFAYPDISAGIQKARGRLIPLGWYHLLHERKRTDWVNVNGVGLLPAYQGSGANTLLYAELAKSISALGFKHVDVVQVNETNFASRSDMEAIGVTWYKRHRSYCRDL